MDVNPCHVTWQEARYATHFGELGSVQSDYSTWKLGPKTLILNHMKTISNHMEPYRIICNHIKSWANYVKSYENHIKSYENQISGSVPILGFGPYSPMRRAHT